MAPCRLSSNGVTVSPAHLPSSRSPRLSSISGNSSQHSARQAGCVKNVSRRRSRVRPRPPECADGCRACRAHRVRFTSLYGPIVSLPLRQAVPVVALAGDGRTSGLRDAPDVGTGPAADVEHVLRPGRDLGFGRSARLAWGRREGALTPLERDGARRQLARGHWGPPGLCWEAQLYHEPGRCGIVAITSAIGQPSIKAWLILGASTGGTARTIRAGPGTPWSTRGRSSSAISKGAGSRRGGG
jgi:hypothetical protein